MPKVHTYTYSAITTELRDQELVDFDANSKEEIVVGFSDDGRGVQSSMMMETAMKAAKANNSIIVALVKTKLNYSQVLVSTMVIMQKNII